MSLLESLGSVSVSHILWNSWPMLLYRVARPIENDPISRLPMNELRLSISTRISNFSSS